MLTSRCGAPATSVQCTAAEKSIQSQMNVIVPRSDKSLTGLVRADYHSTDRDGFSLVADAQHYRSPNALVLCRRRLGTVPKAPWYCAEGALVLCRRRLGTVPKAPWSAVAKLPPFPPPPAHLPYEPKSEGGSCRDRTPRRFAHLRPSASTRSRRTCREPASVARPPGT